MRALATRFMTGLALAAGCGPAPADLVLYDARVYTLAWGEPAVDGTPAADAPYAAAAGWHPDASAIAVRGGVVVYLGDDIGAQAFRGPGTEAIDLEGATVLPGLIDSHVHIAELGARLERVDLVGVATPEEAIERMALRAAQTPPGQWIIGWGWDEGAWASSYPDNEELSQRIPDQPAVLRGLHTFAAWANRAALVRAGITADTPDPDGGEILRDGAGRPTGVLLNRAVALLDAAVPPPTDDQVALRVKAGLDAVVRSGYVAVHEAGARAEVLAALERLEAAGALPIRVYAMPDGRDTALAGAWLRRGPDSAGALVIRALKAYYDGAMGSRGARLLEDYSDMPGHRGLTAGDYGFDHALVARAMAAGWQVAIHAIGDAGNRETLDFLDSMLTSHPGARANRHRIEHAQVVHPDDLPRFAALQVIASMQPPHAVEDKAWAEDRLGPVRVRHAYAWRSLRRAGARLVFNSDLAGSDHDIFYGLHAAMTRRDKAAEPAGGWYPEEAMTPEEAVRGYTGWAAFAGHEENRAGRLAVGRPADLSVLSLDPFVLGTSKTPEALLDGKIVMTLVGGRVAFRQ